MPSPEVIAIYAAATDAGVRVWVDGGWCVDALVGKQTREHDDLDLAVDRDDLEILVSTLTNMGYHRVMPDTSDAAWNFVMANDRGWSVDLHAFHFDVAGHHVYGVAYPACSLRGSGIIDGHRVNCILAESMYRFKSAYRPAVKDLADIGHLERILRPQ